MSSISFIPKQLKLEKRKADLKHEFNTLFGTVNVSSNMYEIVYSCCQLAELHLYSKRERRGPHKKEVILNFILEKVPTVDREMISKMIDSIVQRIKSPSYYHRFVRYSRKFRKHNV